MKNLSVALLTLCFSASIFASPVNINKASAQEIAQALNGVGLRKAEAIVAYRKLNGAFRKGADLVQVRGIGPSIMKKISQDIRLK